MQDHQLPGAQAQGSVSVPIVVAEHDLEHGWREVLYYGADPPTVQTPIREIFGQSKDVW